MMKRFKVWYAKSNVLMHRDLTKAVKVCTDRTHELVAVIYCHGLEKCFDIMNGADGDHSNPLEDQNAQEYLKNSDVNHTSMSVGDVLEDALTGTKYWCDSFGWTEIVTVDQ